MGAYEALHERARQLIAAGLLPMTDPARLYGGYGSNHECQLCAAPITAKEVEFELEFATSDSASPKSILRFHLACHAIWDYERKAGTG